MTGQCWHVTYHKRQLEEMIENSEFNETEDPNEPVMSSNED